MTASAGRKTLNEHVRVLPEQWERIEAAARGSALSANPFPVALDRRELCGAGTRFRSLGPPVLAAHSDGRTGRAAPQKASAARCFHSTGVQIADEAGRRPDGVWHLSGLRVAGHVRFGRIRPLRLARQAGSVAVRLPPRSETFGAGPGEVPSPLGRRCRGREGRDR